MHYVRLSRNMYIHYVRLRPTFHICNCTCPRRTQELNGCLKENGIVFNSGEHPIIWWYFTLLALDWLQACNHFYSKRRNKLWKQFLVIWKYFHILSGVKQIFWRIWCFDEESWKKRGEIFWEFRWYLEILVILLMFLLWHWSIGNVLLVKRRGKKSPQSSSRLIARLSIVSREPLYHIVPRPTHGCWDTL